MLESITGRNFLMLILSSSNIFPYLMVPSVSFDEKQSIDGSGIIEDSVIDRGNQSIKSGEIKTRIWGPCVHGGLSI